MFFICSAGRLSRRIVHAGSDTSFASARRRQSRRLRRCRWGDARSGLRVGAANGIWIPHRLAPCRGRASKGSLERRTRPGLAAQAGAAHRRRAQPRRDRTGANLRSAHSDIGTERRAFKPAGDDCRVGEGRLRSGRATRPTGQPGGGEWTSNGGADDAGGTEATARDAGAAPRAAGRDISPGDGSREAAPAAVQYFNQESGGGTNETTPDRESADAEMVPAGYTVAPGRGAGEAAGRAARARLPVSKPT
jgi:hypothetical protein